MAGVFNIVDEHDSNTDGAMGPDLLGRLFDRHAAALELFARQWCECPEDVVQEALIELVAQSGRPTTWRRGSIAWFATRRSRRARSARRRRRHETEAVDGRSARVRAVAGHRIDAGVAAAAIESLPIELREVVVARIWAD